MKRARLALELLFQRQVGEQEDASIAMDRMAREIQGTVFALLALFLLVALTSYIPLDSIGVFQGRLDQINNFAGIVGAIVAEAILGSVGVPGYSMILLVAWLSISTFREISIKNNLFRILGVILGTMLTAISLQLLVSDKFPEASLWQGGVVGKSAGAWLKQFFNIGGAMLIVSGGYLVTFILTTGFSLSALTRLLMEMREEGDDDSFDEIEEEDEAAEITAAVTKSVTKGKSRRSRKKAPASLSMNPDDPDADTEEDPTGEEEGTPGVYEFREIIPHTSNATLPTLRLLKNADGKVKRQSRGELKQNGQLICKHLESFQITGQITAISQGPVLTTYEYKPAAGVKLSKIANLQDDLGVLLGTNQLRVVAPIPGKTVVGIEVPRPHSEVISLKDVLSEDTFFDKKLKLPVALGKTTDGKPVLGDLAAMPHLLVAGATGSGKSVFMNSLIMSFLFRMTPQQLRMILIDPKMLEFAAFSGLPHLVTDVITDNKVAINAMNWAVTEMERRYALMAKTNSKNIESYNSKMRNVKDKIPFLVVVVDELADLMMSGGEEVEVAITRLAQKARAAGIHLVIATQRPSAEVVTGLIKANVPSRISFKVPSGIDSRTILDTSGAEELIGRGDSLMIQPGIPLRRLHGTFVTEEELARVVKFVKGGRSHQKFYISFAGAKPDAD